MEFSQEKDHADSHQPNGCLCLIQLVKYQFSPFSKCRQHPLLTETSININHQLLWKSDFSNTAKTKSTSRKTNIRAEGAEG